MMRLVVLSLTTLQLTISIHAETKTTVSKDGRFQIEETLIYDKKIGGKLVGRKISPDNSSIALVVENRGQQAVWTEKYGLSDYYYNVPGVFFSPDSKRLAYVTADKEGKASVLVDGELVGQYEKVFNDEMFFTDDSQGYVFCKAMKAIDSTSGKEFSVDPVVVVNGIADAQYTSLLAPDPENPTKFLCLDGNRIVYFAREENEHFIVIDGNRGPSFDQTGFGPTFSDDFNHIAYVGIRDSLWYVVADSILHGPFPKITFVDIPPGTSEPAYVVWWPDSSRIFVNHQLQPTEYKWVRRPVFSDSGEILAYWASDEEKMVVVNPAGSDAFSEQDYHSVSAPWLSNCGSHYVYEMVFDSDFKRKTFVVDGIQLKPTDCHGSYNIFFSDDGLRYSKVCFQQDPMMVTIWVNGVYGPYQGNWIDPVVFSKDGKHWATRVLTRKGPYFLIDGRKKEIDGGLSSVHFSPNGEHVAYTITNKNRTKEYLVIDETEFKNYTEIGGDKLEFSSDGSLTLFPHHKFSKVYRVRISAVVEP